MELEMLLPWTKACKARLVLGEKVFGGFFRETAESIQKSRQPFFESPQKTFHLDCMVNRG